MNPNIVTITVSKEERTALNQIKAQKSLKSAASRSRVAKNKYQKTQLNTEAAERQREMFSELRKKTRTLRLLVSEFANPLRRHICAYINERDVPCKKVGYRPIEEFEHNLPFTPKFCPRHTQIMNDNSNRYESCRDRLFLVGDWARNDIDIASASESIEGGDSEFDEDAQQLPAPPAQPAMLPHGVGPTVESVDEDDELETGELQMDVD